MMKRCIGVLFFVILVVQVKGAYLLVDGVALDADNSIYLSAGTHTLTWGGTETGNPTPGDWWNNGIIFIHDVDGDNPTYFTGQAAFTGNRTWLSAAGGGSWVSMVGGAPTDEMRIYLPNVTSGDWYDIEFTYDGGGRIAFDAGYFSDDYTTWNSLALGSVLPVPEPATLALLASGAFLLKH